MTTEYKSFINRGNWTDSPCYYVSVQRDGGKHAFVLGPFQHEADCRQWAYYDEADGGCPTKKNALQKKAEDLDRQAVWYAWGMAKAPNGHREAILNEYFIDKGNTFELPGRSFSGDVMISIQLKRVLKQFHHFKQKYPDCILFFRMGDFCETFYEDAKTCSKVLGLTLTSRDKGSENPVPLAGVPYHAIDGYLKKMLQAGYRVAVCEQVEDPKTAKGVVKRYVVRIVTPGTLELPEENLVNNDQIGKGQTMSHRIFSKRTQKGLSKVLRSMKSNPVNNNQIGKENIMSNAARKARKAAAAKKAKAAESETKSDGQVLADEANKAVKIARKDAVQLLTAVGFLATHKASNELLQLRMNKLKSYVESFEAKEGKLNGEQQELADKIITAGKDGVTVVGEDPKGAKDTAEGKKDKLAGKSKPATGKGGEKKASKAKGDRKVTGEVDKFGSRLGTNYSKVNACLTKQPKTMGALAKESGIVTTTYKHLKELVEKKLVKQTKDGFCLP